MKPAINTVIVAAQMYSLEFRHVRSQFQSYTSSWVGFTNHKFSRWMYYNFFEIKQWCMLHTTLAAPAVMAIGAVTALSPDEHMIGILTAYEMEYAAASVSVAYSYQYAKQIH